MNDSHDYDIYSRRCDTLDAQHHAATEAVRPSVLYRPTLMADGDEWCALYGPDLQVGVSGFGETPAAAMAAFDRAWATARTPAWFQRSTGRCRHTETDNA